MSRPQPTNPRWESVAACMVWPDPLYDEQVGKIGDIIKNKRGQRAVERLRIQLRDPEGSLEPAFTIIDQDGDRVITRQELRKAINNGMIYPNHIRDRDFEELLLILDPSHTNWVKCGDFLELFGNHTATIGGKVDTVAARSGKSKKSYTLLELDERLRESIKPQTQNLLKEFVFHDLNNTGKINKQHVKYIIKKTCFPVTDLQFEGLWKIFPLCGPNDMKYLEFMEEYGDLANIGDQDFGISCSTLKTAKVKSRVERTAEIPFDESGCDISRVTSSAKQVSREKFEISKTMSAPMQLERSRLETARLPPSSFYELSGCDTMLKSIVEGKWRDILHRTRLADPRRTGRINARTLREVLMQCGLPVNNKEMADLLEIKYGLTEGSKINYWSFIRKCVGGIAELSRSNLPHELVHGDALILDEPEMDYQEKGKYDYLAIPAEAAWSKLPAAPNYDLLLKKLVDRSWREILKRCRSADNRRTGFIKADDFYKILAKSGIPMSNRNVSKVIQDVYRITHGKNINYWLFLRKCSLDAKRRSEDGIMKPDCSHVYRILLRMRTQVLFFYRALREQFLLNDTHKTGLIDCIKFRNILNDFAITMKDEDFFVVMQHFDPVLTGCIPYVNFLQSFAHPNFV